MEKISVILPCYNVENLIDRCLQSIVSQTVGIENLEIICVNDCSTDNTLNVLLEWEARYPDNFLIVNCDVNSRQGAARNRGLLYSSGEWIAFIDSDDWIERQYLEILYNKAKEGNFDLVCCGNIRDFSKELTYLENEGNAVTLTGKESVINCDDDRRELIIHPIIGYAAWGKLINRKLLVDNNILFPENMTYEDAAWGSILNMCYKRAYIFDNILYHYFVNDTSTVLTKNSNHHIDCITAQTIAWREYDERGFLDKYREEFEIEHIFSYYLAGLKFAIYRYEIPDYNIYLLLRELMLDRIPDYKANSYIQKGVLSELHMLMLKTLDSQLSKSQFYEFADSIKKIGI